MKFLAAGFAAVLSLISGAQAMDCDLAYVQPLRAWKASCGLNKADSKWSGYVQGTLSGTELTFEKEGQSKTVDGGVLAEIMKNVEEIPYCGAIDPKTKLKNAPDPTQTFTCSKIASAIGLEPLFFLRKFTPEPGNFKLASKWDKGARKIDARSELAVAVCVAESEKIPNETSELDDFGKDMECDWNAVKLTGAAELLPDQS